MTKDNSNNDNVVAFRPRKAISTCALPAFDDDEGPEENIAPATALPYSIDVIDGAGGNSMIDAVIPTHIAMAAVAFIMERLALPATA